MKEKTPTIIITFLLLININITYSATNFKLAMPIDCDYGNNCFIQNYVDMNKSDGYSDYKCGFLSYNKHKGTDFRLKDYVQMKKGVKALSAADGVIKAVRSSEADFAYLQNGKSSVSDKECGNGVVIAHANGYTTQYCHMLKDSINVSKGQNVKSGDILGLVGMSGESQFPHLHISVKKDNQVIDPFTGLKPQNDYYCEAKTDKNPIWQEDVFNKLEYTKTAILNFFMTDDVPQKFSARAGNYREDEINQNSKSIIFWADIMGVSKKDKISFNLKNRQGDIVFKSSQKASKKYALYFVYSGKKIKGTKIPAGEYKASIDIYRKKLKILSKTKSVKIS